MFTQLKQHCPMLYRLQIFQCFLHYIKTFIHNLFLLCFESVERKTFLQSLARIGREKVHYRHDVRLNKNEKILKNKLL